MAAAARRQGMYKPEAVQRCDSLRAHVISQSNNASRLIHSNFNQ
jgi:hypothetical protein